MWIEVPSGLLPSSQHDHCCLLLGDESLAHPLNADWMHDPAEGTSIDLRPTARHLSHPTPRAGRPPALRSKG